MNEEVEHNSKKSFAQSVKQSLWCIHAMIDCQDDWAPELHYANCGVSLFWHQKYQWSGFEMMQPFLKT